ncbi:MAG TPA: VOC family protein [Pseudolysinimonas sp.]|nr:VOC family protein [Pseudolysinimonas sp.]
MPIRNVIINVADVARSVEFYRKHLDAIPIGEPTAEHALLDVVVGTLELRRLDGGGPSPWQDADTNRGFRHVGFKVANVDEIAVGLDEDGVRYRLRPIDIDDAGVRISFFFDPDGTVVEIVENHVTYHEVFDEAVVAAERRMPVPPRPRLDHVGHAVADLDAAVERYRPAGFADMGILDWGHMRIDYLRGGETVLELFSFPEPTQASARGLDTYGFAAVGITGEVPGLEALGTLDDGRTILVDPDDLPVELLPADDR